LKTCSRFRLGEKTEAEWSQFSCGDSDPDSFFLNDTANYERQLLGKTWCFALNEISSAIVCAFTLSTSSIDVRNIPRSRRDKATKDIPHEKSSSRFVPRTRKDGWRAFVFSASEAAVLFRDAMHRVSTRRQQQL
jgi:hypothetical protein